MRGWGAAAAAVALGGCALLASDADSAGHCPEEIDRASAWATRTPDGPKTHVLVRFAMQSDALQLQRMKGAPPEILRLELAPDPDDEARHDQARYVEAAGAAYRAVDIFCGGEQIYALSNVKPVR